MELLPMEMAETVVLREAWDVDRRLAELGLPRDRLLKVRDIAMSASRDATPFHPANAAGTLAYQQGTFALRNEYVGEDWLAARPDGVETIQNDKTNVSVAYANVDTACDDNIKPKPRSRKGAGAERVCRGNLLFGHLPEYAPKAQNGHAIYYLMVGEGGAVELTRPVVKAGTFTHFHERIFLSDGSDLDGDKIQLGDSVAVEDFDPRVIRK